MGGKGSEQDSKVIITAHDANHKRSSHDRDDAFIFASHYLMVFQPEKFSYTVPAAR